MKLADIPDKLPIPFANAGAKVTIPVDSQIGVAAGRASLTDGFPPLTRTNKAAGGIPPFGTDMNGILYEMSAIDRWNSAGAGYPYDSVFATTIGGYPKGAKVLRSDSQGYWLNTVDDNTTDPEAGGAGWVPDYTYGAAAVSMTGSNVTLTSLQAGRSIILITGALSSDLNLIFPTYIKSWTILNQTTGGFSITAKTAGGSGVALGIGANIVSGDGTNIYSPANQSTAIPGMFSALSLSATGNNSNVAITCGQILLAGPSGEQKSVSNVSLTLNLAASGLNGLDAGSSSSNTWYSVWIISDGSTTAGLLSTSSTTPTLPTGYVYKSRVGWIRSDSTANKYPLSFVQKGNKVQYKVASGTNVTSMPIMASGAQGSTSVPTFVAISVSSYVPPTAGAIDVVLRTGNQSASMCAPNNQYGNINSITNMSTLSLIVSASTFGGNRSKTMLLESSNIYYASDGSVPTDNLIACAGWEDNI